MISIDSIVQRLAADFPAYKFSIYRGLFEKYIAVEIHGKIVFTIWVDQQSEYKELLDEVGFSGKDWLQKRLKSRFFHRTRFPQRWLRGHVTIYPEKLQLFTQGREHIRERLELSLQNIHIE